jgi:hypothetical protein
MSESSDSGFVGFANLPNQVHRKAAKRGFEFTLMVVGKWPKGPLVIRSGARANQRLLRYSLIKTFLRPSITCYECKNEICGRHFLLQMN